PVVECDFSAGIDNRLAQVIGRALRTDNGEIGTFPSALAADEVAADASALAKELLAMRRIARRTLRAALLKCADIGDDLTHLDRREEDSGHGGSSDAVGDVAHEVGVSAAVVEDAGGEGRAATAFAVDSVALTAVRAEDFGAGRDGARILARSGRGGDEQNYHQPHYASDLLATCEGYGNT